MSRVPMGIPRCGAGSPQQLPKSNAALCIPQNSESMFEYDIDPGARVLGSRSQKKKSCKHCCSKSRSGRTDGSPPPMSYHSSQMYGDEFVAGTPILRGIDSPGSPGGTQFRQSPLPTPPPLGSRSGSRSPRPIDVSLAMSPHNVSLENTVHEQLMVNAARNPFSPARAGSGRMTTVPPIVVMTSEGPVPASHQVSVERTLNRLSDAEVVSRRMTGTRNEDPTSATQIELNFQNLEPGGLNAAGKGGSLSREMMSATTTLTVGPGVTSKTTKTVYECTKPESEFGIDPAQVLEMIEEESKEVEKMKHLQPPELKGEISEDYGLKKRLQKMKLNRESVRRLESSVINPPPTADEQQEELQPEVMAAIMHTEEQGLTMDSAPANVYNYLFPEPNDDMVMKISSVAPSPLQNVVVPVEVSSTLHTTGVTREMQFAAANTQCTQGALPIDNIYEKSVLKTGGAPKVNNTAVQDKKVKKPRDEYPIILGSETPPWGAEDLQPLMTLVGASPSNTIAAQDTSDLTSPSIYHNELENSLEYQLIPEAPRHVSKVQLRGTQKPSWFPGYIIALPDSIKLAKSPSEVLPAAWQAVQPDIFADDSFVVVG